MKEFYCVSTIPVFGFLMPFNRLRVVINLDFIMRFVCRAKLSKIINQSRLTLRGFCLGILISLFVASMLQFLHISNIFSKKGNTLYFFLLICSLPHFYKINLSSITNFLNDISLSKM